MEVRRPFEMELPPSIYRLSEAFTAAGYQLYVVGGAVRDALMGLVPKDFDLATNATPDQVSAVLAGMIRGIESDLTGKAFGVVRVRFPENFRQQIDELCEHEIATFREDITAGRHPEVRFATIREDVQRRDLTINALFYDINERVIVDLVGGLADIENRVIRTVGNPEDRFREDRLRIMRAFRFAARFGWTLEARTLQAIYADNNLDEVSPERVRDEFVRGIASAKSVRRFLSMLDHAGMWPRIFPGLKVSMVPDVMVSSSGVESRRVPVVLSVLLDENPVPRIARELNELKYTSAEVAGVCFLHAFRDISIERGYKLWKQFQSAHLSPEDLIEYVRERGLPDARLYDAFLNYAPMTTGTQLLSEGFKGVELGRELERRETVRFRELYGSHLRVAQH